MSLHPLYGLEPQIYDARRAAQVLAQFFEDCELSNKEQPIRLTENEHELLSFLIYELCRRAMKLETSFQEATGSEQL